jgi:hypothetical protein
MEVEVTSGDAADIVVVAFCVLVLMASDPVTRMVSVLLTKVVDFTSDPDIVVLAVKLARSVVVEYTVTSGRLFEMLLTAGVLLMRLLWMEVDGVVGELMDDEAVLQTCAEPKPTENGCVST